MTSSDAAGDSCHVHSSSPLVVSNQVEGPRYFKSEVETNVFDLELETDAADLELETDVAALQLEADTTGLKLETYTTALDLEMETDVPQETLRQE
jgi:hypothetical protein